LYRLDSRFTQHNFTVSIVGCGGTGGFVAEGLCRFLPPHAELVFIDHDRVEERNLIRQNFTSCDLGKFKSEALAGRLATRYQRPIAYSNLPVELAGIRMPGLVIGCVDNGLTRREIARKVTQEISPYSYGWWIDAGNGENYGQVIIGNYEIRRLWESFEGEICHALPLPTIQRPELLQQRPREPSCAEALAQNEQSPVINQAIASLVLEMARRLIEGSCPWVQLYLDLDTGTLTPVMATLELVSRITGISERKLERR